MLDVLITLGAIALGAGLWLFILRRYDRIEPEALRYLLPVAVLGGFASVFVAALVNEGTSNLLGVRADVFDAPGSIGIVRLALFCLVVGISEEVAKAVATIYTTRHFGDLDEPVDAMIYAMTVALGFAAFENLLYATQFGNEVLLVRFLWPVPAHMGYAAIWGWALARARFVQRDRSRVAVMAPAVAVAAVVHAGTNFLLFMQGTVTTLMSLMVLVGLLVLADRRLNQLVIESPFLEPGECPNCRNLNAPSAATCVHCGFGLQSSEIFVNCPCGRTRVNVNDDACSLCGRVLTPEDVAHPRR